MRRTFRSIFPRGNFNLAHTSYIKNRVDKAGLMVPALSTPALCSPACTLPKFSVGDISQMTDLRSKYLPAIFILSAGTLLLLSAWIFLENRHITQLEDTLRETRIELGRARLEAARSCEPDPSAGEPPESENTVPDRAVPGEGLSAADILAGTRVIAHGMGAVDEIWTEGSAPLNCLEGFLERYEAGVRVFEADLRLTRDGKVVLRHDWWPADWQEGINGASVPTREEFLSKPIFGVYTPLSFRDLLLLLKEIGRAHV